MSGVWQAMAELADFEKDREIRENLRQEMLDKATKYMQNVRKNAATPWDGQRVKTKGSLDQIQHKVLLYPTLYLEVYYEVP